MMHLRLITKDNSTKLYVYPVGASIHGLRFTEVTFDSPEDLRWLFTHHEYLQRLSLGFTPERHGVRKPELIIKDDIPDDFDFDDSSKN